MTGAGGAVVCEQDLNAARFLFVNLDKYEEGGASIEALAAPDVRAKAPYGFEGKVPLADGWLFARIA